MKRLYWLTTLAALTTLLSTGSAQVPDRTEPLNRVLRYRNEIISRTERDKTAAEMNENIEIMRRLLARKLSGHDGAVTVGATPSVAYPLMIRALSQQPAPDPYHLWANANTLNTTNFSRTHAAPVEGVYLDGKGIVFTVTMPMGSHDPRPTSTTTTTVTETSEWVRIRQQLRGETPEPATKTETTQPSTADIILKLLAENGKHFRLRDDDEVAVVVTFRGEGGSAATINRTNPIVGSTPIFPSPVVDQSPSNATPLTDANPGGHGKSARDFQLLGDLHLRQGQYQPALDAFNRVIAMEPNADPNQLANIYRKLAETKLHLGRLEEAKAMLDSAVEWEKKAQPTPATTSVPKTDTKPKPEVQWPAKLIVTATKKQLDEVGSGKLSLEDFRKGVKVDYVSPTEKK